MTRIEQQIFGMTREGQPVHKIILKNKNKIRISIINFGAILASVSTPDADGEPGCIALGFNSLTDYENDHPYLGATVGRFANRIKDGTFTLARKKYTLATNNGPNHLHGGNIGFDKKMWDFTVSQTKESSSVSLSLTSPDGEEGYPGELKVNVTYTLNDNNELSIDYLATTDKKTIINLTNHSYWNLKGVGQGTIKNHTLFINADSYLPINETSIPTGEILPVKESPFYFLEERKIGDDIDTINGYDHCYALNHENIKKRTCIHACTTFDSDSGRRLEIYTDQPGLQLYTGNFLNNIQTHNGVVNRQEAFALETQNFPDAPNQKEFPSSVLNPGEEYKTKTIFKFSIEPRKFEI